MSAWRPADAKPPPRFNDPATAPNVPVRVSIEWGRREFEAPFVPGRMDFVVGELGATITVVAWDRETDQVSEYEVKCQRVEGVVKVRPPDSDDREWLRNIGARP